MLYWIPESVAQERPRQWVSTELPSCVCPWRTVSRLTCNNHVPSTTNCRVTNSLFSTCAIEPCWLSLVHGCTHFTKRSDTHTCNAIGMCNINFPVSHTIYPIGNCRTIWTNCKLQILNQNSDCLSHLLVLWVIADQSCYSCDRFYSLKVASCLFAAENCVTVSNVVRMVSICVTRDQNITFWSASEVFHFTLHSRIHLLANCFHCQWLLGSVCGIACHVTNNPQ